MGIRRDIRYVSSSGKVLPLNGEEGLFANVGEIMDWEWSYASSSGRIRQTYKGIQSRPLSVFVAASTEEEGRRAKNLLYEVVSPDTEGGTEGRLYYNDWYLPCMVTASSKDRYWRTDRQAVINLTVSTDRPWWYRERSFVFTERGDASEDGLNYPYDYPYDYGFSRRTDVYLDNESFTDSDVLIRMYGISESPSIVIAGNSYGVGMELELGEYVEIDTMAKTIVVTRVNGDKVSSLPSRMGEYREGSGSYIFEKVPPGLSRIVWDGDFDFDVVVISRRSEPEWT